MPGVARRESGPSPVGVALVGYGAIAEVHAAALSEAGARLVTVTGPDHVAAERFAAAHGVGAVDRSLSDVLVRDDVTAVVIASPNAVHAEQASAALEAGRHALVEIPLALSLADGERLVAMADSRGLTLGVSHTLRFWTPYATLASAVEAARPRVRHVIARRLLERRRDAGWSGRSRTWTDDLLWHHGGHAIDAVLAILGEGAVDVWAVAGRSGESDPTPTEYGIGLRSPSGAIGTIALSYGSRFEVADLMVLTDTESWHVSGADVLASHEVVSTGRVEVAQAEAVRRQDRAFIEACRGGATFAAVAHTILPTLRIQQAVAEQLSLDRK